MNNRSIIKYLLIGISCLCLICFAYRSATNIDSDGELHMKSYTVVMLSVCGQAVKQWQRENGRVPTATEGLAVLKMNGLPLDGWGRPLVYRPRMDLQGPAFDLYSLGPRGVDDGGNGDNISYWKIP